MTKVKIPATRPQWTSGNYTLWIRRAGESPVDELAGYFRQFQSAFKWRNYLAQTDEGAKTIWIQHNGSTVSIWHRGSHYRGTKLFTG